MAEQHFINVPTERFNEATRRLQGASSIIAAFSVFASEDNDEGELPITQKLLAEALQGVNILIDDAEKFLVEAEQ